MKYFCLFCALISSVFSLAVEPSGTLPTMYINTDDGEPITSDEIYVAAHYYIDPLDTGYDAIGTADEPLLTEIRGRGNYTWTNFDKKPYKLKLDKKTSLLGMPKNKHWALLANADAYTILTTPFGQEVSRRMGLAWTPNSIPIEVVLNGEYIGLYNLCETVRVDPNRVNITEQPDNSTDPEDYEGAWLVEIDNYPKDAKIVFREHNDLWILFTPDTPEELSDEQLSWITEQMQYLNSLIYAEDKSDSAVLESVLDFETLARYYLTYDLLDNIEGFSGSCYIYKDKGEGQKWTFGPVWDFGNCFLSSRKNVSKHCFDSTFNSHWIGEIIKFPAFIEQVKATWATFKENNSPEDLLAYLAQYVENITAGVVSDREVWVDALSFTSIFNHVSDALSFRYALVDEWYGDTSDIESVQQDNNFFCISGRSLTSNSVVTIYSIDGVLIATLSANETSDLTPGYYIIVCDSGVQKIAIQ